ncbi:MAG: hypothetical protein AB8B57_02210 [Congregibacter sp.]
MAQLLATPLRFVVAISFSIAALNVHAQVPSASLDGLPATPLIGEEFCFDVSFTNTGGTTGYGPYLILVLDPGVQVTRADFVDIPPQIDQIGVFDASGVLSDPISELTLVGVEGGTATLLRYPVGSVDQGQPALVETICMSVDTGTAIGSAINVDVTPGFEFGDTTIGTNGPITGTEQTSTVTPQLARIMKENSAPEGQRTPGPSHPFLYTWTVDVSEAVTIENLQVSDMLPAAIQWTGDPISVTAPLGVDCSITESPNSAPTTAGTVTVNCDSVLGSGAADDLVVTVPVYISDVLDETMPDSQNIQNTVNLDFDFQGEGFSDSAMSSVIAEHAAVEKSVSGTGLPGGRLTYVINFHLSDYPDAPADAGANTFVIDDIIADGLRFDGTLALVINGSAVPISAAVVAGPGAGETSLSWDIASAVGGVLPNGSTGSLTFETTILEDYSDGNPVQASDPFDNAPQLAYSLTEGGSGTDESAVTASIEPNVADKSIASPNPLPSAIEPGTEVIFELSLSIPAGNTSDIVFTDFLPRPVFSVLDFNAGTDLSILPPFDSISPTVSIDSGNNSVRMEFGDVDTPIASTLRVRLSARIVGTPFADALFLTNLLSTSYTNTLGTVIDDLQAVALTVGAPSMTIIKGVVASDNPNAQISPNPPADPTQATADSNINGVDAFDVIDYLITVENTGGAPAFNVTIDETPSPNLSCANPSAGDIVSGAGRVLEFSGDLSSGVVLDAPLAANDGTEGAPYADDTALLTLRCTLSTGVEPLQSIENEAGVTWTSIADPGAPFTRITDTAEAVIATPEISKSIVMVTPGYSSGDRQAHVGELVTYEVQITVPEGTSSSVRLEDIVNNGLAFVDVLSVSANSAALSTSEGSFADVLGNAGITSQGGGVLAPDRKVVFGPGNNDSGFGTITNSNSDNATDETITVSYRVRVLNATVNTSGRQRRNGARWLWQASGENRRSAQVRAAPVRVVEPRLQLRKTFSPNEGDESTPPIVTLTLNHLSGSTADAFDLDLGDALPENMFVDGPVDTSACPTLPDNLTVTPGIDFDALAASWASFELGSSCQITFQTRFGVNPAAGASLENCSEAFWESLPDVDQPLAMPPNNTLGVERTGNNSDPGQLNNYRLLGCAVFNVFGVGIEKTLVSTDQAHTDSIEGTPSGTESLTIGEEVTFELVVTIPDANVPELQVTDILPVTSTVLEVVSASTTSIGNDLSPATPNPTPTITDRDGDGVLDQIELNYGAVTQAANGSTDENDRIRIQVVARVKDQLVNANNDLTSNIGLVRFSGLTGSDELLLELVEPVLTMDKTADRTIAEAGDAITYTVSIAHDPSSRVEAQDVVLDDLFPPELNVIASSVGLGDVCSTPPSTGPVFAGGNIGATWDRFPLGAVCEVTFQTTVDVSAVFGDSIINESELTWTSLDTDGDPDDRRYDISDRWSIGISEPGLDKQLTATDVPDTAFSLGVSEQQLTIGETGTFTVVAEFPDGTSEGVSLRDQVPVTGVALQITDTRIVSIGADLSVSSGAGVGDAAADCTSSGPQNCALWTFGNVVNTPDSRPEPDDEDRIVVEIDVIVLDDAENSGAPGEDKNLRNDAVLTGSSIALTASANFDIVEPLLTIRKLTPNGALPAVVAAGETRRFTLEIAHLPLSTAPVPRATITDLLNTELLWVDDSTVTSDCPGFAIDSSPATGSTGVVEFSITSFSRSDASCEIAYDVVAAAGLTVPGNFPNQADLMWESAPGSPQSRMGLESAENSLVSLITATISKVLAGTSVPGTGASENAALTNDVAIGERISYLIATAFTEGTTSNVVFVDTLEANTPDGPSLEFVSGNVSFLGSQISTSLPGDALIGPDNVITVDFGTVTNLADLVSDVNDTLVYELVARVVNVPDNEFGVELTNDVALSFDGGSAMADAVVEIVEPDISANKSFTDLSDGVATIEITVSNSGTSPAYELEVSDDFDATLWIAGSLVPIDVPDGFTLEEASGAGTITITLATQGNPAKPEEVLDPGESITLRFSMELMDGGNGLGVTQIDNTINVVATSLPGIDANERSYPATSTDSLFFPALALSKTWSAANTPARPGDTLTYTLELENTGQGAATSIVIADTPDAVGEFVVGSVSASAGGSVLIGNAPGDTTVSVSFPTLAASATVTVSYSVRVPLPYPGPSEAPEQLSNQAVADAEELAEVVSDDPTTGAAGDATVVPIVADPVMRVSKDDQVLLTAPATTLAYRIDYGNVGDQDATGVVITDTVPANTAFSAASSSSGWSCADGSGPGTRCDFTVGDLSITPGSIIFAVQVDETLPAGVDFITNTVEITDDGRENDPNATVTPSTDSATEQTPLGGAFPQLTIDKDDGGVGVTPGQRFSYLIDYANIGNQAATGVVITETVPQDVIFSDVGSAPTSWSCPNGSPPGTPCSTTIPLLLPGAGDQLRFGLDVVLPAAAGRDLVLNTVSITDDGSNSPSPATDTASDDTPIIATPDIYVSKETAANSAREGDVILYIANYGNRGDQDATNVVVRETVPEGAAFNAGESAPTSWSCPDGAPAGSVCEYLGGSVSAGFMGTLNFAVDVVETPPQRSIVNVIDGNDDGSNGTEPTPSDNTDTVSTPFPSLSINTMNRAGLLMLAMLLMAVAWRQRRLLDIGKR